jgi:hypothetical protein
MDWKSILGGVAPTLATALSVVGGPAGMVAGAALRAVSGAVLGHQDGTADQVTQAIQAGLSPDAIAALQKADNDFKVQMAQIAAATEQAQLTYEKDIYAEEAGDRANARDLAGKQPNDFMRPVLGLAVVAATIAISVLIILGYANTVITNTTAALTVGTVIGYLFSESKSVLGFYFGMTKDSSAQTKTITDFAVAPGSVSSAGKSK